MDQIALRRIYRRAIKMNHETFSGQEFDLGYHSLMVGLHCAQRLDDVKLLSEVERIAYKQLNYIDEHHPDYNHSSRAAKERNHVSIFQTLGTQARARILMIESRATLAIPNGLTKA